MSRTISLAAMVVIASMCAASAQTLKLDRLIAAPGDSVRLSAAGFHGAVDVYFDKSNQLARKKGNALSIQVPASALPGKHWLTVVDRKSGDAARAALTVNTDWRDYGFDAHGTRYNKRENIIDKHNVSRLALAWKEDLGPSGGDYIIAPIVIGNSLFVMAGEYYSDEGGDLRALDTATGTELWTVSGITSEPAGENGVIYAGSVDKKLYAFDATTGAVIWSSTSGSTIAAPPIVAKGLVYAGSIDGHLYAFNAGTGALLWSIKVVPQGFWTSPAYANGVLYVMASNDYVFAYDAQTGAQLWSSNAATGQITPGAGITVIDGEVYASTNYGVWDYDAMTGAFVGQQGTVGSIGFSFAIANGLLFGGGPNLMEAWDSKAERLIWWTPVSQAIASSPAVANGVVFAGCEDGNFYAFNARTGKILWSASTGSSGLRGAVTVANGMAYVASWDGLLFAYALDGGKDPVYRRDTQPPLFSQLHPERN